MVCCVAESENIEVMREVLALQPDEGAVARVIGARGPTAHTPTPLLHMACSNRLRRTLEFVLPLASTALLDQEWSSETPLMVAATSGDLCMTKQLLDRGASVTWSTLPSGEAVLHKVAKSDHPTLEMVELLVERGADPLARTVG